MRLVIDSMIALMLVGLLAGVLWYYQTSQRELEQHQFVRSSMALLQDQVTYHGALAQVQTSRVGLPTTVSPSWFGGDFPVNIMLDGEQVWLDIAPPGDHATDPPDPIVHGLAQGGFWYNPNNGVIRARVPAQFNEAESLALYNEVNGTDLDRLPQDPVSARQPLAAVPKPSRPAQLASPRPRRATEEVSEQPVAEPAAQPDFSQLSRDAGVVAPAPKAAPERAEEPLMLTPVEPEPAPSPKAVQGEPKASDAAEAEPEAAPAPRPRASLRSRPPQPEAEGQ